MRGDIAGLQSRLGVTTLYVTHDQVEAMTMGHRVAVLSKGVLQQCDTPRVLYDRPANTFVAGFIGSPAMNLVSAPFDGNGCARVSGVAVELPSEAAADARGRGLSEVVLGLRPESLELAEDGIPARVEVVEELGADAYAFCMAELAGGASKLVARADWRRPPERGTRVALRALPGEAHVFDPASGDRLGAQ
jgi:multiple sugar transport system ATP-binding protein